NKSLVEILTMASVVEKEAPTSDSMGIVADIFWRRYQKNWALQSCATVNYITGKNDPGVTDKDRAIDSLFNTYKYPGLPLGPISNPSLTAIKAVIYPIKNDYWYFMSGTDGAMHYAKTLEEHNRNVFKYLR
ncbi:MAG: Aminodeoxychorismate lyase, partial [uncultured bacterium]